MSNLSNVPKTGKRMVRKVDGAADKFMLEVPRDSEKGFPLLRIYEQYHNLNDLVISDEIKERLEHIILENNSIEKLNSFGFKPKNKILFCGPPGTGKTLTAKIISSVMNWPLVYVAFDSILSSYLGETATNLRKIFDFIENDKFVVLFDEFDIVGKQRDDPQEHGEIKRVVNNFIQMIDTSESNSIIIAATNHQHLLDKAVWRRFDEILYFDLPNTTQRKKLFQKYLRVMRREKDFDIDQLIRLTRNYSAADISQICEEALRKSILNNKNSVTKEHIMWAISEQKRRKKAIHSEKGNSIVR